MGKKRMRRLKVLTLMCICMVLASSFQAYAYIDPDLIQKSKEAAEAADEARAASLDDDEEDYDDNVYEEDGDEPEPSSAQSAVSSIEAKYQPKINDINDRLKDLESEKKKIQSSLDSTKSAKQDVIETKNYLDQQIAITRSEIALLEERIELLEASIIEKEAEIESKQGEIDESYDLFKTRLRALYVTDDATTLGLILGSDSFSDFLSRTEAVSRVTEHDRTFMQNLTDQRIELEDAKADLEETMEMVEADKLETEEKRQTLSVQVSAAQAELYSLEQLEKEFQADLEKNKALSAQMQRELEEVYRQIEWDKNPYIGGEMAWPLPGFYNITSNYGWRFNGSDYHTGIDISGANVYGSKIAAANGGTVKVANWSYTPGYSYGIYVIIDHGGGMSTLYGHCSNLLVSVGDVVTKGQAIAEVGSTGWSTGPHLHFEVRENGAHKNPISYVTGG